MTSRLVFGGPLSPLGWCIGFLRVPFDRARNATECWYDRILRTDTLSYRTERLGNIPLLEALRRLDPLQTPPKHQLVVATSAGWTAHFMNSHLGGDSASWTGHLSEVLSCEAVIASHIPVGAYPLPSTQFQLMGPSGKPPLRSVRTVHCGKYDSGRWEFGTSGAEQPYEEIDRYASRLKRDRFDRGMLLRYLEALGMHPDEPSFWGESMLIETSAPYVPRTSTVAEERCRLGLP